ncbi:MAG TPA: MOSC N-terminal beta barrel domain-containing protein, partial [Steroidobacteraceae bacterium]|nr:MOSC N-terminal beta barrel domain-containing protein [Steroidobacteraceae bacterium]
MSAVLTGLYTYPVKGCRAISHDAQKLTPTGLAWDRHWMFISPAGRFLTQRECPRLACIEVAIDGRDLVLSSQGHAQLRCPIDGAGARLEVTVWRDRCMAQVNTVDTREWFEAVTGRPGQLVRSLPGDERTSERHFTGEQVARVRFADGYALLVANQGSLDDLNARLERPVPMERFRPNMVLSGLPPFAEDEVDCIRIGEVELRLVKPCTRCIVTTTDQQTGERQGDEPLRTLGDYRWLESLRGVGFGMNAIVV